MTKKYAIKGLVLALTAIAVFTMGAPSMGIAHMKATSTVAVLHQSSGWMPVAYAVDPPEKVDKVEVVEKPYNLDMMMNDIAKLAMWSQKLFQPMIHFFAFNIGNFLGTDYIYEGAMGTMLQSIWVVSRNIVNICFVLILLGLALKEIFGIGQESSELKTTIGKFALLLIAVNFTWLATKVVLDAANVATNVVFSIPSGVVGKGMEVSPGNTCDVGLVGKKEKELRPVGMCYPTAIYVPVNADEVLHMKNSECAGMDARYSLVESRARGETTSTAGTTPPSGDYQPYELDENGKPKKVGNPEPIKDEQGKPKVFDLSKTITYCWENLDLTKFQANTASIYLTYGMARIQQIIPAGKNGLVSMSVSTLFSFILILAYLGSLAALFIALIVRMGFLWVFVAFSPFLVLLYYLGIGQGGKDSYTDPKAFINWAFVPAKVAVFFSVAFLMVSAGQNVVLSDLTFFDRVNKMGNVTVRIIGARSLIGGIGEIQQFIWYLITVAILWAGTFSMLSELKVASAITNKINEFGVGKAKWLGRLPYHGAIIPVKDDKGGIRRTSLEKMFKGEDYDEKGEMNRKLIQFNNGVQKDKDKVKSKIENNGDHQYFINTYLQGMNAEQVQAQMSYITTSLKETGANEISIKKFMDDVILTMKGTKVPDAKAPDNKKEPEKDK